MHLLICFIVGNTHVDEHDVSEFNSMNVDINIVRNDSGKLPQSSVVNKLNMIGDSIVDISSIVTTLVDNVDNTLTSNTSRNGMFVISFICSHIKMEAAKYDACKSMTDDFYLILYQ